MQEIEDANLRLLCPHIGDLWGLNRVSCMDVGGGHLLVCEQPIRRGGGRMDSLHKTCTRLGAITCHRGWSRGHVKATLNFSLSLGQRLVGNRLERGQGMR